MAFNNAMTANVITAQYLYINKKNNNKIKLLISI